MVFFVCITVNQSHLRPICKSTKFNPKIQRTIYLINFQQLRLHVPDFIRTVVIPLLKDEMLLGQELKFKNKLCNLKWGTFFSAFPGLGASALSGRVGRNLNINHHVRNNGNRSKEDSLSRPEGYQ